MIITENVESPGIKKKMTPGARSESQPPRRDHPQQVPVGEERNVSLLATRFGDDAISTVTHLLRWVTIGTVASPVVDRPTWFRRRAWL